MHLLIENNTEEKIEMDADLERTVKEVLKTEGLGEDYEVSITFVDREEIHRLNREFRDVDRPTDVLSFPLDDTIDLPDAEKMLGPGHGVRPFSKARDHVSNLSLHPPSFRLRPYGRRREKGDEKS